MGWLDEPVTPLTVGGSHLQGLIFRIFLMTFSGPYEGIQRPYGRIWAGGEKKSKPWLPTDVMSKNLGFFLLEN